MPNRTPFCAANWKMHKTRAEAAEFLDAFLPVADERLGGVDVFVCPPFTSLDVAVERCAGAPVSVAAQNMHFSDAGAFTGEVSGPMLTDLGVDGVILGHSERRRLFAETDEALAQKLPAALGAGLTPILCVGESLDERESERTQGVLRGQVEADLAEVDDGDLPKIVIAYEPIWAIGTGRNATPVQAAEAIGFIRSLVADRDQDAAAAIRLLYGGSVKPDNAAEVLASDDIDGALVGGASLDPGDFADVAAACA
jgi:triosephosphate isomerase